MERQDLKAFFPTFFSFVDLMVIDKAKFSKFRKVELYDKRNVLVASISARRGENNGTSMGQTVKVGRLKYKVDENITLSVHSLIYAHIRITIFF